MHDSYLPSGSSKPANEVNVGKISNELTISSERPNGAMLPFQCANALWRTPPSHVLPGMVWYGGNTQALDLSEQAALRTRVVLRGW